MTEPTPCRRAHDNQYHLDAEAGKAARLAHLHEPPCDFWQGYEVGLARLAALRSEPPPALDAWARLLEIYEHLNALRSDGPFMDTLTSEGPWWTPADAQLVALHEAIVGAKRPPRRSSSAALSTGDEL